MPKKIFFPRCVNFVEHRSGWGYAMSSLTDLHSHDGAVLLDDFIENNFSWQWPRSERQKIVPYSRPWIGFIHNPPNMPQWFGDGKSSNQKIFERDVWKKSLNYCQGLFTLSEYHKNWLKEQGFDFPISNLYHPTETPELKFSFEEFEKNRNRKIIQIGWWLRKRESIHRLRSSNQKAILELNSPWLHKMKLFEGKRIKQDPRVRRIKYLKDNDYDLLLSKHVVFLDLYDSSANNAIIECIVRNTPVLVNRIPAVVEYLGEDYPFYFETLKEAGEKSSDMDLIEATTKYLENYSNKYKLSLEHFKQTFIDSEVYRGL